MDTRNKMNSYEAMFIVPAAAAREKWPEVESYIRDTIESVGGEVAIVTKWDERKLVYEIKKNSQKHSRAAYVLSFFNAPPSAPAEIKKKVKFSDTVLRVLILKDEKGRQREAYLRQGGGIEETKSTTDGEEETTPSSAPVEAKDGVS